MDRDKMRELVQEVRTAAWNVGAKTALVADLEAVEECEARERRAFVALMDGIEDGLWSCAELERVTERANHLEVACALLCDAYCRGDAENGGSVEWSDLDQAYAAARSALGDSYEFCDDDDGPTVCPVCGSSDCIMADDGIPAPKFCPNSNGGA